MRLSPLETLRTLAFVIGAHALAQAADQPNFLFIAVDDLKPLLGHLSEEPNSFLSEIYPDPVVRARIARTLSPNMDKLAAQGVDFRRAYCPAPLCCPSRTSTLTGIATHHTGIYDNDKNFRASDKPFVRDAITLPEDLRTHGYYTAGTGKIFHHGFSQVGANGQPVDWPDAAHSWSAWIERGADGADSGRFTPSPWSLNDRLFRFGTTTTAADAMDDYQKADLIGRVLETGSATAAKSPVSITLPADRPFFLACGIFRPHLPFIVPPEYLELFKSEDIQITRAFYNATVDDLRDLPPGAFQFIERPRDDGEPGKGRFSDMLRAGKARDPQEGDLKAWREMIRHYLASVAFADHCVGRLLDALDRSRYRDNTVVILWSDHGWDLGTKFRAAKEALWESTTNCVLTIRDPATPKKFRGTPSYACVTLQDLYRTVGNRASVAVPEYVAGRDIGPLLKDPAQPWDEVPITTEEARNHALRDANYRYIRYADQPDNAELYDEKADPREHTNRLSAPELRTVRERFDAKLQQTISAGPFPYDTGKSAPVEKKD